MPPEELQSREQPNDTFEMESQFILRLPHLPAASLKAAVKSGVQNLKDRLSIQLDPDIRNGKVRFDGWVLPAKIVDLPTIIESHKTLDNRNFYKTADICQIMVCKEEAEEVKPEESEEIKKTKDGKDKRYLYPHGITAPLKNIRKKRFRKMLRKKYIDFPEIEKEVKRLLRTDNEVKYVRYEIVNVEDEKNDNKDLNMTSSSGVMNSEYDVGDLFGDVVSSSDDDDSDDGSRLSGGFKDYLKDNVDSKMNQNYSFSPIHQQASTGGASTSAIVSSDREDSLMESEGIEAASSLEQGVENESIRLKMDELEKEIRNIQVQRLQQQFELDNIENIALKQRFQAIIDDLQAQELSKSNELNDLKNRLMMWIGYFTFRMNCNLFFVVNDKLL